MAMPPQGRKRGPSGALAGLEGRWMAAGALVTAVGALVAAPLDSRVATGILLGGGAGTLAFRLLARQTRALGGLPPSEAVARIYRGVLLRLAIYGVALTAAYSLDPAGLRTFAGAVGALVLVRLAVVVVGAVEARRVLKRLSAEGKAPPGSP